MAHRTFVHVREVTGQLPVMPRQKIAEDHNHRDITELHPYTSGRWFYVELHITEFGWFGPVALATVHVQPDLDNYAELVGMYVLDGVRREGLGRKLVEEVGKLWPNVTWCSCWSSREFCENLVERGIAKPTGRSTDYFDFVPKSQRQ